MDASTYGKHITVADGHVQEAYETLDMGVNESISEECALLCADTQLMLAIMDLEDARRKLRQRMTDLEGVENV